MKRQLYSLRHTTVAGTLIGHLQPILLLEVLPGDTFRGPIHTLARFTAVKKPTLTNLDIQQFFFYVPYRMLWSGWETFITQRSGTPPSVSQSYGTSGLKTDGSVIHGFTAEQLLLGTGVNKTVSKFPLIAVQQIFNEFFRDEDDDGLSDSWYAPTAGNDVVPKVPVVSRRHQLWTEMREGQAQGDYPEIAVASNKFSIEKVRDALRVMRLQERREAFGDRYFDILRSYGVRTNFELLEKPEYLGGSRHRVSFTDVVATGASTGVSVGDIAGHAITGVRHRMGGKSFREHGLVIGFACIRPRPVNKAFGWPGRHKLKHDDFWAPEYDFQTPVGWDSNARTDGTPIGYLPKFQEYRKVPDVFAQASRSGDDKSSFTSSYVASFGSDTLTLDALRKESPSDYDDLFIAESKDWHAYLQTYCGLKAYRLVARHRG